MYYNIIFTNIYKLISIFRLLFRIFSILLYTNFKVDDHLLILLSINFIENEKLSTRVNFLNYRIVYKRDVQKCGRQQNRTKRDLYKFIIGKFYGPKRNNECILIVPFGTNKMVKIV